MISLEFLLASLVVVLVPGTGVIYTVSTGLLRGRRASAFASLGCALGILPHLAATVLGLAAVLHASALAFQLLKFAGALYLLYLAWGAWRASPATGKTQHSAMPDLTPLQAWRRGVLMNVTNPKVMVFFLALFPSFIDPQRGNAFTQTLFLGALFMLASWVIFSVLALLSGTVGQRMQHSPRAQRWLNRSASVVFVGLALRLLYSPR